MQYVNFNKKILNKYIERSNSRFINLAFDEYDIEDICDELPIFKELQSNWNKLLEIINDEPQYFGLIAIQCLAASQRQADSENDIGENEYQIRLRKLLGITNDATLQQLYKGIDAQNPIQEQIWFAAKDFFLEKYDLELKIPQININAGRYVQYPKSQSFFTKEDLKRFTVFFSENFHVDEDVSFDYFYKEGRNNMQIRGFRKRVQKLLENTEKQRQCYEQIFNYFNDWDGTIYNFDEKRNQTTQKPNLYKETSRLILYFENNQPFVHLDRKIIDWKNIFNIPNYKYFQHDLLFFSKHEYYHGEYEDTRQLESSSIGYIVLNTITKPNELSFLNNNNLEKTDLGNNIFLYKVISSNIGFGSKYELNPARFKGGIRTSRKREYLVSYAPNIVCEQEISIIFEHKKIVYNPTSANEGTYKIRVGGYKDIIFNIVATKQSNQIIGSLEKGWNLQTLSPQLENAALEGGLLNLKNIETEQPIIRNWIDANLKKTKSKYKNHLLTAINRAKNGNFKNKRNY